MLFFYTANPGSALPKNLPVSLPGTGVSATSSALLLYLLLHRAISSTKSTLSHAASGLVFLCSIDALFSHTSRVSLFSFLSRHPSSSRPRFIARRGRTQRAACAAPDDSVRMYLYLTTYALFRKPPCIFVGFRIQKAFVRRTTAVRRSIAVHTPRVIIIPSVLPGLRNY